jgi:hypothetical protein
VHAALIGWDGAPLPLSVIREESSDVMEVAVRKQIMVAEPIGNELQKSAVGVEAYEQHLL